MKKRIMIMTFVAAALISLITLERACAYWIWTPETKKFVNPKYAVKDSPKEQFEWAMSFYQAKDYQKAAQEFEKLTKQYEYSEYASKAQYYAGLCYENMNKLYFAFQNYQKAIDNFPHIENMEEIIAREFNIATIYEGKASPKVLGTDIMTSTDRAVEIYKKVVDNAPFGRLADESQFRMGQAFKKADRFDEAIPAFQKILDDYPNSQFIDKVKFEVADCAYRASLKPAYDIESTDKAIKAFEELGQTSRYEKLSGEAAKTIQRLKDKAAEKSFITAQFYESQRHYESAIIYYKDVVARFPDSSIAVKAKAKIEDLGNRGSKNVQSAAGKEGEKKSWMPFSIPKKPKIPKPQAASEDVKSQKKSWQFFKFAKPVKKEKSIDASVPKPAKPKGWWNPLKFTSKPKREEASIQSVTADSAAKEKKGWTPLSFTKKPKPSEPAAVKEEAESQATETGAVKETPVQETVIIQDDVVIRKAPPRQETAADVTAPTNKIDQ